MIYLVILAEHTTILFEGTDIYYIDGDLEIFLDDERIARFNNNYVIGVLQFQDRDDAETIRQDIHAEWKT